MSRPEDISEEAWEQAGDLAMAYVDWLGRDSVDPDAEPVLVAVVARALRDAQQTERERSAKIAENRNVALAAQHRHSEAITAIEIAAAIRENAAPEPANHNFKSVPHQGEIR